MVRSVLLGAASLALVFATSAPASAQTATTPAKHPDYHHAKHKKPKELAEGRQITVHKATPSWLTLGGVASPSETSTNNYVLDTFDPPNSDPGDLPAGPHDCPRQSLPRRRRSAVALLGLLFRKRRFDREAEAGGTEPAPSSTAPAIRRTRPRRGLHADLTDLRASRNSHV